MNKEMVSIFDRVESVEEPKSRVGHQPNFVIATAVMLALAGRWR
jgi:hypothetical protein